MTLAISTICDSISSLSVSGLTIKDLNEIPEAIRGRDFPVIYPKPDGFVTNFEMVRNSFGGGSTAKMTVTYDLTYRLLGAPIGAGRGLFDSYSLMVEKVYAFIERVLAVDTMDGLIDIVPAEAPAFGPVTDPAGGMFHGADVIFHVMDFVYWEVNDGDRKNFTDMGAVIGGRL